MAEEEIEEQEESSGEKKQSSPLVLIIIIVVLILFILIGIIVVLMMGGSDEENPQQPATQQERPVSNTQNFSGSAASAPLAEIGPMFPLDTFTVNLLSESGRRYLKVEMNLELGGEELAVELESKTAVIRDIVIRLLSSKSLEEISTAKGKQKLKEQIVDQLNMRLRDGRINNVYFTEFVVQ